MMKIKKKFIEDLKNEVLKKEFQHIHVFGDPGIGKTRCVFEATKNSRIRPLVLYYETPEDYINSKIYNYFYDNEKAFALVIIDECDREARKKIKTELEYLKDRIKIITIYNENDDQCEKEIRINIDLMKDENIKILIEKILGKESQHTDFLVKLCEGFPRVAKIMSKNFILKEDVIQGDDIDFLWKRYIINSKDIKEIDNKPEFIILTILSVFYKFGYKEEFEKEEEIILDMIEFLGEDINQRIFRQTIESFRKRKILQGYSTLYISPKIFHIWLWVQFWENYGKEKIFR